MRSARSSTTSGQYDRAFHWFSVGAKARRQHLKYDVRVDEKKLSRIMEVFPSAQSATDSGDGDSPGFIFIVGLPRSGTTLLERILTRLPGVVSNGETENFSRALFAEASAQGPDPFARAAGANFDRVGRGYAKLAGHSASVTVIEKLPLNYLYLGAIRRALPAASVILLNREPLDVCFAMFRTLFGEAYPFKYQFHRTRPLLRSVHPPDEPLARSAG